MGVSKGMDWLVMMGWPGRMGWREWISLSFILILRRLLTGTAFGCPQSAVGGRRSAVGGRQDP